MLSPGVPFFGCEVLRFAQDDKCAHAIGGRIWLGFAPGAGTGGFDC